MPTYLSHNQYLILLTLTLPPITQILSFVGPLPDPLPRGEGVQEEQSKVDLNLVPSCVYYL